MGKLKKCPFCGEEVKLFTSIYKIHCVRCVNCGIGTDFLETAEEAVNRWNKRAAENDSRRMLWREDFVEE